MRRIKIKPSRRLGLLLVGVTLLAVIAVQSAALPGGIQLLLGAVAMGWSGWSWRRMSRPAGLRVTADGRLQCLNKQDEWCDAEILADSFVSTGLLVIRYRISGQPIQTLVLLPDSVDADDMRRLRVSLRWTPRTRSDTSFPGAG